MVAASSSNENKAAATNIFGTERLVLLHSPDPIDLGLRLEYSPIDGRVRIVYTEEDDNNTDQHIIINNGVVEGTVHNGDVVVEAAGVNMRKPISDHMWKLTEGLMKVAPRPIEIIVATMMEKSGEDDNGAVTTANAVASEMDPDGMASVYGASVCGTYYQLEMGENAQTTDAMIHHLPGEYSTDEEEDGDEQLYPEVVHNPFEDVDRFGTERRIIFHTQSLGVKLHRSASEGIVHILTVTPYKPFDANDAHVDNNTPMREGPDNGYLEAGDTIFEVGGVDLRGKVIGKLEWADMVHFIKHVHRPLDMVVAKDKLFTLERAGVTKDVADDLSNAEVEEMDGRVVGDVEDKEDNGEQRDDPETNNENHGYSHMLDNTCFNIAVDDICNLPCGGGKCSTIPSSPTRADNSWIKQTLPETKVHPWNKKADDNDDDMESVIAVSVVNKKYEPSITSIFDEEEQNVVSPNNDNDAKADSTPTRVQFFSRTGPTGKPMVPVSPVTTTSAPSGNPAVESGDAEKKLTVSQLREMFSPIQSVALGGSTTSIANTDDDAIGTPILKPNARAPYEQEQANRAQMNGLFSPIVQEDGTPKPPHEDTADVVEETLNFDAIRNAPAPDSPGDWSTKSPLSDKSIGSPVPESGVADVIMSEARNDVAVGDMTQSMIHDDCLVEVVSPPPKNSNIVMEQAAETNVDEGPSNVAKEISRPDDNLGDAAETIMHEDCLDKDVSPPPMHTNTGKKEVVLVPTIAQAPSSDAKSELRPHMPFYARTHPKGKSSVVQQTSPVRTSPIVRTAVAPEIRIQAPTPEPSTPHPNDETNDSSFHSTVLHDLKDEFHSRDTALHSPESRDDRAEEAPSKTKPGVDSLMRNPSRSEWVLHQHKERHDLSPTGSTVSVEDKTTSAKKSSADATFFTERFFHTMDAADSPFVGNIKFATPNQRVPASALFSEAFLVQKPGTTSNSLNNEPINVRWVQTDSPLFVTKKQIDEHVDDGVVKKDNVGTLPSSSYHESRSSSRTKPPSSTDDDLLPNPDVKRFNNLSAFDMTNLEGGLSLIDCDPDSESPSFELNDTIVYADSTEEAQKQCCTMSNLCGSDTMFEGLVQNCIDIDSHRQMKERVNKIPSPRRKNLLERIRNKKKKNKLDSMKNEYGNLGDDGEEDKNNNDKQKEGKMKRIRKAKVQLTFQNMRGQTMASANQFALLMDDEISF